jgi:two-component system sensor histidine kinase/response regulator
MPEMDGFEATAEIRRREQTSGGHIRIIAMTAHAMAGDRDRCLLAGMDGYVTKPIDRRLLCAAVEQEDATPATDRTPTFEREAALQRLDGDAARLTEAMV